MNGTNDSAIALALITIVGSVIAGLFKLLAANTRALNKVATSSDKVAKATNEGAKEAKQRNGHLGDQNVQIVKLITGQTEELTAIKKSNEKIAKTLGGGILNPAIVKDQHIQHQDVKNQVVNEAT